MPDVSLMLDLCNILGITVNELLSGERIIMEDYQKRAEENLMELQAKKRKSTRRTQFYIENFDCNFQFIFCA